MESNFVYQQNHRVLAWPWLIAALGLSLLLAGAVRADQRRDLTQLSIEELMNLEITSVSKKAEPLSQTAAAAYVITAEDIRRSGYSSVPELLRLVPGLEVARIDLNTWAITARGFNGQWASKLLVLIDGRSVYSPLFSGVFWDQQDVMLEDIDRIEIIRGPGATMWGANAVNGVINIITKESSETRGMLVSGEAGAGEHYGTTVRYGGPLGKHAGYRIYSKGYNRLQPASQTKFGSDDRWNGGRGGFRLDAELGRKSKIAVFGDISSSNAGSAITTPQLAAPYSVVKTRDTENWGGYLLTRYQRDLSNESQAIVQMYYDHRVQDGLLINNKEDLFDFDFQHHWSGWKRNELIWGLGYRVSGDRIAVTDVVRPTRDWQSVTLFSGFLQDEITAVEGRLRFTAGSKFEHNSFTGYEIQPNARVLWTPHARHSLWSSAARAVRTPSVGERNANIVMGVMPPMSVYNPSPLPVQTTMMNSPDFGSEILVAYEAGYRVQPTEYLGLSVDGFYNEYTDLRSFTLGTPAPDFSGPIPYVLQPLTLINNGGGHSQGIELSVDSRPAFWWRMLAAYTYLTSRRSAGATSGTAVASVTEFVVPKHQASIRSSFDVGRHFEFDIIPRYVSEQQSSTVDEYLTCDLRAAWKPVRGLEVYAAGQNLTGESHYEFNTPMPMQTVATKTERIFYMGMSWRLGEGVAVR